LHYAAEFMAGLGGLPGGPVLAWRDAAGCVRHTDIASELVVGRRPGEGLTFAEDDLLSRRHFRICHDGTACALEDLNSRNGTTVNSSENRIRRTTLRDGDLIYAGRQILVYLNPARI
jgi:pSer/pThr/pTyr-binding forkhead associated (FHA) protein